MTVRVQNEDFDAGREIAALRQGNAQVGAVAAFVGVVRDMNDGSAVADMEPPAGIPWNSPDRMLPVP